VSKPRVLLVEDNPGQALLTRTFLEPRCHMATVTTGTAARIAFIEYQWDLIILDLFLDQSESGWDVLRAIKSVKPEQKVVVKSAAITDEIRQQCIEMGADAVIEKTGHPERLLEYLNG